MPSITRNLSSQAKQVENDGWSSARRTINFVINHNSAVNKLIIEESPRRRMNQANSSTRFVVEREDESTRRGGRDGIPLPEEEDANEAADVFNSSEEELEFHMGMMNAMEEEDNNRVEDNYNNRAEEDEEFSLAAARHQGGGGVIPNDDNSEQREDEEEEAVFNSAEELEFHLGMIHAMEAAEAEDDNNSEAVVEADADEEEEDEFARGMMEAMMEEERHGEEEPNDNKKQQETILASLSNNIYKACSSVSTAVRDYYRMSQDDQVQVWDDLTGAKAGQMGDLDEPKDMVEAALQQLPIELQRMPNSHPHDAFELALEKSPSYVNNRKFLLSFLRAEKFDVYSAAIRICRHFEEKLQLFGEEALGRDITLQKDFDIDDMETLKCGYIQVLQHRDFGHRPIIFWYKAASGCYKKRENLLKTFWYIANRMSQDDEEVQKLGFSNIVYNIGGFPKHGMDYEKSRRVARLIQAVPVRFNNIYVCLDDKPWLTVVETFAVMITRFLRVRLRMIKGTHEEAMDKLKAVGVPANSLPVNDHNELILEPHLAWIEKQRQEEEEKEKE